MAYTMFGSGLWRDERQANLLDGGAPFYDTYRCADGRYVAVGALEPQFYAALIDGLGLAGTLAAADQYDRGSWPVQRDAFSRVFATRTRDDWAAHFAATDGCVAPVLSLAEAPAHPHLADRGTFVTLAGVVQPRAAPRFSRTPGRDPTPGGANPESALLAWGLSADEVRAALEDGELGGGHGSSEATR
jgi:alpha-methylacyl-CoA racemase